VDKWENNRIGENKANGVRFLAEEILARAYKALPGRLMQRREDDTGRDP
jgi:hypothetical protein